MHVARPPATPDDSFANVHVINCNAGSVSGSIFNVINQRPPRSPLFPYTTLFRSYRWTTPTADPVTIDTVGSAFNTLLADYTSGSVSGLTTKMSNDDIGGTTTLSRVSFTPVSGSTYQIALDGFNGATGSVTLNLNQ